jgi:hypothetical protein
MQQTVGALYSPAVAGDFASKNPRFTYDAGPGGLVVGPATAQVGRFAWVKWNAIDYDNAPSIAETYNGTGPVSGFVGREQQALISVYLQYASMIIPQGFGITVYTGGDFWCINSGTAQALPGMVAYANFADGSVYFAASGTAAAGGTSTASTVTAETISVTGSISGNVLTVTAVGSGSIVPGTVITNSGPTIASGTTVVYQLSGTSQGVGTYALNIPEQTIASGTITGNWGLLTVGGTVTGTYTVGGLLSGTSLTGNNIRIYGLGTGTGGAGTYYTNYTSTTISSESIASTSAVATKWVAFSPGLTGELVKMSSQPTG